MSPPSDLTDAEKIERARQALNTFAFPSAMVAEQVGHLIDGLRLLCNALNSAPPSLWDQAVRVDDALVRERSRQESERQRTAVRTMTATMTKTKRERGDAFE